MASSYTGLGTELMTTGENAGTWGTTTNTNLQIIEQLAGGYVEQSVTSTPTTLSVSDGSTGATLAHRVIKFTGTISANTTVTVPLDVQQLYILVNGTAGAYTLTFKYASGSGSTVTWAATDKGTKLVYATADHATNPNMVDSGIGSTAGHDLDGNELILDADADTSITADTDDQIDIKIAGADDFQFTANTFTAQAGSTIAAQALTATTITASGIVKTDDTTEATSTTDGSLQTDGGLSVAKDAVFGDDVKLLSDSAVLSFGADSDTTLTHTDGTGLTLNSTNKLTFQDTGTYVGSNADGDLDVVSDGTAVDSINIESAGGITLDAGTASSGIVYEDDGTEMARIHNSSSDVIFESKVQDKDIIFKVNDGGSSTEVARFDGDVSAFLLASGKKLMIGAAEEYLSGDGTDISFTVGSGGDINIGSDIGLTFGNDGEKIEGDGTDLTIAGNNINLTAVADVVIPANVGITFGSGEKIEGDSTDLTVTSGGAINLTATTDVVIPANVGITFGSGEKIEGDSTDLTVTSGAKINLTATSDVVIPSGVGLILDGSGDEKIESDGTDISFSVGSNGDINIPNNIGLVFGGDSEKIEGDGTDMTISANNLTIDCAADLILDAGGDDFNFKASGTEILRITNSSSDVIIKPIADGKDIIFQQRDGTEVARVEDAATFNFVTDKLAINGTAVTATAAELNLLDGGTSVGSSITLADADGIVVNDGGSMKTIPASDLKTYNPGGTSWQAIVTGNTTMVSGRGYFVNTTSAAITMTLPSSPSLGDTCTVIDYAGTADTNNITIGRNSQPIMGSAADLTVATERAAFTLVYVDSTHGWLLTEK